MAKTFIHVDAASAGGGNGSSWDTSGANAALTEAELETYLEGTVAAETVIFIKGGTYTLDSAYDSSARNGTAILPILLIGVKSTTTNVGANIVYSDWATGTGRPLFDCGAYQAKFGNFYRFANIRFQGSVNLMFYGGTNNILFNCSLNQNYGTANARYLGQLGNNGIMINCELTSANNKGMAIYANCKIKYCYFHNINGGAIVTNGGVSTITNNKFAVCGTGVDLVSNDTFDISDNDFYNCTTGIAGTDPNTNLFVNNAFYGCTKDISFTTQSDTNMFWNNLINNTVEYIDTTSVYQDYAKVTGDPAWVDPANGNFQLQAGSPCLKAGFQSSLGVG